MQFTCSNVARQKKKRKNERKNTSRNFLLRLKISSIECYLRVNVDSVNHTFNVNNVYTTAIEIAAARSSTSRYISLKIVF